jgi:hypothetical protein
MFSEPPACRRPVFRPGASTRGASGGPGASTRGAVLAWCLLAVPAFCPPATAQTFASRGFADARVFLYPQAAPGDPTRVVGEALARYEPAWKPASWLRVNGTFDARIDTHDQVERRWFIDWQDRGVRRPPFSIRRLSAVVSRGGLSVEIGKQFIRWGKADVLNPTDRFAPRDFLSVVDDDFLGVTGARAIYESGGTTIDAVWVPHFTPSRIPLFDQRWVVLPLQGSSPLIPIIDAGSRFPSGSQAGVRWNRSGAGYEFSLSFYNGYNHLPLIDASLLLAPFRAQVTRAYPQMRMYGGDFALPNRWATFKGEIGYFTSRTPEADQYGIYVLQLERQAGEWLLVGGYAGDFLTRSGVAPALASGPGVPPQVEVPFAADRGLARAFLGRASLSLDVNSSLAFQAAVRRSGDAVWLQAQYSRACGGHVRATLEGNLIRGSATDFLGQYRRNSNVNLALRYSF